MYNFMYNKILKTYLLFLEVRDIEINKKRHRSSTYWFTHKDQFCSRPKLEFKTMFVSLTWMAGNQTLGSTSAFSQTIIGELDWNCSCCNMNQHANEIIASHAVALPSMLSLNFFSLYKTWMTKVKPPYFAFYKANHI